MSDKNNDEFIENARYNFKESLDLDTAEGYEQAQAVIKDVADISKDEAERMQAEYDEAYGIFDKACRQDEDDDGRINEMRLEADLG